MMFHLLTLDSTQHRYGPGTLAAQGVMAQLDAQVGEIVRAVTDAGIADRTTFFIVSDHGFRTVKRQINPNVALAAAGLVEVSDGKATKAEAWVVPEGGSAVAFVTSPDPGGQLLARMKQALTGLEGVDRVIEPGGYAELGLPDPTGSNQMGELFLIAKDGYAFTAAVGWGDGHRCLRGKPRCSRLRQHRSGARRDFHCLRPRDPEGRHARIDREPISLRPRLRRCSGSGWRTPTPRRSPGS